MSKCNDTLFYKIIRPIAKGLFIVLYRPKIIGKENIPKDGKIILAGNHKHNFDAGMLLASTKRCVHFLAKIELFKSKFGWFFKAMGLIPVDRKAHDGKALKSAMEYLDNDKVIGIFPEGTHNKSNDPVLPFKIGAVKMSYDAKCKIVPFVIKGEYKIFHKGPRIIFFKPFEVKNSNLDKANEKFMKLISDKLTDSEV